MNKLILNLFLLLVGSVTFAGGVGGGGGNKPDVEFNLMVQDSLLNSPNSLKQLSPSLLDQVRTTKVLPGNVVEFKYLPAKTTKASTYRERIENIDPSYLEALKKSFSEKDWAAVQN